MYVAIEKMNLIHKPFVLKDSYIDCFEDEKSRIMAHKNSLIIGFEAKNLRDVNGQPYFCEMFNIAIIPKMRGLHPICTQGTRRVSGPQDNLYPQTLRLEYYSRGGFL